MQDVDMDRGALRLEKNKKNKTNDPRAWALSPGIAPALRAWLALRGNPAPSAPLFVITAPSQKWSSPRSRSLFVMAIS
ncbi:hypothetical protein WME98_08035 [Sorangium sp. So ce296]|uniref:hypothetical protein n=1 Tax=Sorangium sp. So ce296 TaxID=3133296 RepID=UPI003F5E6205